MQAQKIRKVKAVEGLGTFEWNGVLVHDFLLKWMIFLQFAFLDLGG